MEKIPTILLRNPDNRSSVLMEINPGCEWVLNGEGEATRKYDGTCIMFDGTSWWARREVKPGKETPANFVQIVLDENTGKIQGWEPIDQSPFAKPAQEATDKLENPVIGTYELVGPKIQGNPENYESHEVVLHDTAERIPANALTISEMVDLVRGLPEAWEGIVWHHPDGRMAKLKKRDLKEVN